jgi:hypothetical protein
VGKELVVLLLGGILQLLVLVGDRPLLPVLRGAWLQLMVLQLMLLLVLLVLLLWELRLPGLARAKLILLVPLLVGIDMRFVVGSLVLMSRLCWLGPSCSCMGS